MLDRECKSGWRGLQERQIRNARECRSKKCGRLGVLEWQIRSARGVKEQARHARGMGQEGGSRVQEGWV